MSIVWGPSPWYSLNVPVSAGRVGLEGATVLAGVLSSSVGSSGSGLLLRGDVVADVDGEGLAVGPSSLSSFMSFGTKMIAAAMAMTATTDRTAKPALLVRKDFRGVPSRPKGMPVPKSDEAP